MRVILLHIVRPKRQAEKLFRKAIRVLPTAGWTHASLGVWLFRQQRLGEARGAFQRSLLVNPSNVDSIYMLGGIHSSAKRHEEAVGCHQRAVSICSEMSTAASTPRAPPTAARRHTLPH